LKKTPLLRPVIAGLFLFFATGVLVQFSTGIPVAKATTESVNRALDDILPGASSKERGAARLKLRLARTNLEEGAATFIRIFKQEAELEVWLANGSTYRKLHTYPICHYSGFLGPKLKEGDKQSPEGFYAVSAKQLNPNSSYYLSFNLGFPNAYDKAHDRTGSYLMVHGNCVSIGCYAMTDDGISEIYRIIETALTGGQKSVPVHIFPFRMNDENIAKQPEGLWSDFWANLTIGYDLFEEHSIPPVVGVSGKRYVFNENIPSRSVITGW